jgi:serine/threonine protein kinase
MGVCLYTFLFGAVPFKGNNLVQIYENIKNEELSFDLEVEISPECRDLIVRILTKDPDKRPSLVQVMEHTWVTKNGVFPLAVYGSTPEAEQVTVTEAEVRLRSIAHSHDGTPLTGGSPPGCVSHPHCALSLSLSALPDCGRCGVL